MKKSIGSIILLFVFLTVLIMNGCAPAPTPEPTPTPVPPTSTPIPKVTGIEGRVYFAGTDEPIPDVTILLNDPQLSGGPQQNPELDADGCGHGVQGDAGAGYQCLQQHIPRT